MTSNLLTRLRFDSRTSPWVDLHVALNQCTCRLANLISWRSQIRSVDGPLVNKNSKTAVVANFYWQFPLSCAKQNDRPDKKTVCVNHFLHSFLNITASVSF